MKLVNAALKEFVYSFKVFNGYREHRKVSIFGSARSTEADPNYEFTRRFAAAMAERGWMVITGAGPGIMAAGHEGAGAERSFGAAIRLPMEGEPNEFIEGDPKLINFKYFFTRKVTFLKESNAFALLPGGFGTLDETFELLTLMQTGKSDLHPIVLLEVPGGTYWQDWLAFIREDLGNRGLISDEDMCLIKHTHDIDEAVDEICGFYRNYHSQRYVDGSMVLRLQRLPSPGDLDRIAAAFSDILRTPEIKPVRAERPGNGRPRLPGTAARGVAVQPIELRASAATDRRIEPVLGQSRGSGNCSCGATADGPRVLLSGPSNRLSGQHLALCEANWPQYPQIVLPIY